MSIVSRSQSTHNKENENVNNRKAPIKQLGALKRKVLSDSTNIQNVPFTTNKRPALSHCSVPFKKISIISDDENSNATAPSPTKSTSRDLPSDRKVTARKEEVVVDVQGPPLTSLQLPFSMWCFGIPHVPDIAPLPFSAFTQSVDSRYARDPEFVSFLASSMYTHFFAAEQKLQANSRYMSTQINFTEESREKMVNLMMNLSRGLQLQYGTLFLAVHVMDSYMPQRGSSGFLTNSELATIVYSSLMIAAKFEEGGRYGRGWFLHMFLRKFIQPDKQDQDETKRLMIQCEMRMVLATSHLINLPTMDTFLNRFLLVAEASHVVIETARCLCERSLLEYSMLRYLPSLVAASAVSMALAANHQSAWSSSLQQATGYTQLDLSLCLEELQDILADETVQRARKYAQWLLNQGLLEDTLAPHTFGDLSRMVYARGGVFSQISLRRQSYESYLLPILERACLSSTNSARRVDMDSVIPHITRKAHVLDCVQYRHHHAIYNKLITCCFYDVNGSKR